MKLLSTTPTAQTPRPPSHDEIAQRARELWEQQGCPVDRDQEIWLEAERQLLATMMPAAEPTPDPSVSKALPQPEEKVAPQVAAKPRSPTRTARGRAAS